MELGAFSISLTVKDIVASRAFYEKFGFRVIGQDGMPPYFRRIHRVLQVLGFITNHEGPLIMRLD